MAVANPPVGMVIPVWYPADAGPGLVETLLGRTLDGVEQYCPPENVVLVLDGEERWQEAVQAEATARAHRYHYLPINLGKGAAVAAGIAVLESVDLRFIVTRDGDGAHLISDLPALVDLAELMGAETGNDLLIVSGGRRDRVRPLGFARAEYEHMTDRVLWQALQYHAAREGRVLRGTYFAPHDDWPDLQSGYKVYSAVAARMAAQALRSAGQGCPDGGLSRCGVETLPAVVILSGGGEIGQVTRRTSQEQPVSGHRDIDPLTMYAEPLLWALRRLRIPGDVAAIMLDDALLRSLLLFDASRRDKVLAVRTAVLAGVGTAQPLRWGARFF